MKENFYASVCHKGVHGGAVKLADDAFIFCCQKLTIPNEFKEIKISYSSIKKITRKSVLLIFPIIKIELTEGKTYKFLIFNVNRFLKVYYRYAHNFDDIK